MMQQLQVKPLLGDYIKLAIWCGGNDNFDRGECKCGDADFSDGKMRKFLAARQDSLTIPKVFQKDFKEQGPILGGEDKAAVEEWGIFLARRGYIS